MKTIEQYFAEMSAAGLAPEIENVYARYEGVEDSLDLDWLLYEFNPNDKSNPSFYECRVCIELEPGFYGETIHLRSNGKDLVKLEWKKPTEEDVGKMCWFYSCRNHKDITVYCAKLHSIHNSFNVMDEKFTYYLAGEYARSERYCLLATHGRLCPEPSDFEEVYKC